MSDQKSLQNRPETGKPTAKPELRHELDLALPDFSQSRELTDVVLTVEGKPIHCSKYVLSEASPVFKAMFQSDLKEKAAHEVPLPGKKYEEMLAVMELIHPPTGFGAITGLNVEFILHIADEYQMSHVLKKCEDVTLPLTCADNAMKYLWLAQEHGLSALYEKAEGICVQMELKKIKRSKHFSLLYETNKVELLSKHINILNMNIELLKKLKASFISSVEALECKWHTDEYGRRTTCPCIPKKRTELVAKIKECKLYEQ